MGFAGLFFCLESMGGVETNICRLRFVDTSRQA